MKFSRYALSIATFLVAASTLLAQGSNAFQAEGTAGDLIMRTAVNGGALDTLDKPMLPGDLFTIDFSSATGSTAGAPIFLAADIAPVSFQWELFGVIGLGQHRFLVIDGVSDNVYNPTQLNFIVPCSEIWNTGLSAPVVEGSDVGLWLQSVAYNGTGSFFGFEVSETIKHEVIENDPACFFYDGCTAASNTTGIDDITGLGVPYNVSTLSATNTFELTGTSGFAQQTVFNVVNPGAGAGSTAATGRDLAVRFTVTSPGIFTLDMCNSDYDSVLYIMPNTCTLPVAGIVVNDDAGTTVGTGCTTGSRSRINNVCLSAGSYLIVIDGFSATTNGNASLVITKSAAVSITSVSPNSGDINCLPGSVAITGGFIQNGATVLFGGVPATNIGYTAANACSATITVMPPVLPAGAVNVTVINPDSSTATLTNGFTYTSGLSSTSIPGDTLGDDGTFLYNLTVCGMPSSFTFYGTSYTQVRFEANGRLRPGNVTTSGSGSGDFTESISKLRTQTPSLNLFWDDLDPRSSASPMGTFIITESSTTLTASWNNVRRRSAAEGFSTGTISIDKATGVITMTYGACNNRGALVGISPGNNLYAADPAEIQMTGPTTFTAPTALSPIFEQMTNSSVTAPVDPFDLGNDTITFTPLGGNGIGPYQFDNP